MEPMTPAPDDRRKPPPAPGNDVYDPVSQPYGGPYPNGVDAAAGGADSSPLDNEPTGDRGAVAAHERYQGRSPANDPAGDPARRGP